MVTKANFDLVWGQEIVGIAKGAGVAALHANELGVGRLEDIAPEILRVIKKADARFFLSRLEKRYLAAAKVFDTYFDAGENRAVAWPHYWLKSLRLMFLFKLSAYVLDEEIVRTVWTSIITPNEAKSRAAFLQAARLMLARVSTNMQDARARQVICDGLHWALDNPEAFASPPLDKAARYMHAPNFVAFVGLMDGIDGISRRWGRPVREIIHDDQEQFKRTLENWHEVYSRPRLAGEKLHWPGEREPTHIGKVTGSTFTMKSEDASAGLQVVDVVLWLFKRSLTDKGLGLNCARLLNRALTRGAYIDHSFRGVGEEADNRLAGTMDREFSENDEAKAREMIAEFEARRQKAMQEYAADKAAKSTQGGRPA